MYSLYSLWVTDFALYYVLPSAFRFSNQVFKHYLDVEDEFGTKYSVLLSKTYESEKELVPEKKGKVRVTGFKQFVAIVDTPKGWYPIFYIFGHVLNLIIHFNVFANDLFLTLQKMSSWYFKGDKWKCLFAAPVSIFLQSDKLIF